MNWHRLILTVGTKLPIATVGPPITLMIDDIFAPMIERRAKVIDAKGA
jgi:hypothetical protein